MPSKVRLPLMVCRVCGAKNDAATDGQGHVPREHDFAICSGCGLLSRYNADLTTRELTIEEVRALPKQLLGELQQAQKAVRLRDAAWEKPTL